MHTSDYVPICIHKCKNCTWPCDQAQFLFVPKPASLEQLRLF